MHDGYTMGMATATHPLRVEEFRTRYAGETPSRTGWEWSRDKQNLERMAGMQLQNGQRIALQSLWDELDGRMKIGQ